MNVRNHHWIERSEASGPARRGVSAPGAAAKPSAGGGDAAIKQPGPRGAERAKSYSSLGRLP